MLYGALDLDLAVLLFKGLHKRLRRRLAVEYLLFVRAVRVLEDRAVLHEKLPPLGEGVECELFLDEWKRERAVPVRDGV